MYLFRGEETSSHLWAYADPNADPNATIDRSETHCMIAEPPNMPERNGRTSVRVR
jgi:hypothetical protein